MVAIVLVVVFIFTVAIPTGLTLAHYERATRHAADKVIAEANSKMAQADKAELLLILAGLAAISRKG